MNVVCANCGYIEEVKFVEALIPTLKYGCKKCTRTDFNLIGNHDDYLCSCYKIGIDIRLEDLRVRKSSNSKWHQRGT